MTLGARPPLPPAPDHVGEVAINNVSACLVSINLRIPIGEALARNICTVAELRAIHAHANRTSPPRPSGVAAKLNPPDRNSPHGRIVATLLANPGRPMTHSELLAQMSSVYPDMQRSLQGNLRRLLGSGYISRTPGATQFEYSLKTLPPLRARRDATPELQAQLEEARAARATEERDRRREKTRAVQAADWKRIAAALRTEPGCDEVRLEVLSGVPTGRLRYALKGMADAGRVTRDRGVVPAALYLLGPSLPEVDMPVLTHEGQRVLDHLLGRTAETEQRLAFTLGLPRESVCLALAHLLGLGLVEWGGVGFLVLWRLPARRRVA